MLPIGAYVYAAPIFANVWYDVVDLTGARLQDVYVSLSRYSYPIKLSVVLRESSTIDDRP